VIIRVMIGSRNGGNAVIRMSLPFHVRYARNNPAIIALDRRKGKLHFSLNDGYIRQMAGRFQKVGVKPYYMTFV
jgi:hypothetical protein